MTNWFSKALTDLRRKASVVVRASTDRKNHPVAEIEVDGEYTHRFPASSRVSKALEEMSPIQLQERLDGGSYFFVNGILFDFRDGNYNGFIHTPESIDALQDVIGIRGREDSRRVTQDQGTAKLSRVWSTQEIQVPGMDKGGVFDSRLTFSWNPFVETIRSSFDIIRLICANGMTGLTSLFSARIPLINRWEEHLDIADKQIQNKLYSMLTDRLQQMSTERATLADCLRLRDHATDRMDDVRNGSVQVGGRRATLENIRKIVSPEAHVGAFYKPAAFMDRRLAAQLPSHLTMFDAYNIATEIATHTAQTDKSSNHALDKFANELIFDRTDTRHHAARFGGPVISSFSDPANAFFGDSGEDKN